MKSLASYSELDELGEALIKDYMKKTGQTKSLCVDIEGFITEYLKLPILYETFSEDDPGKIAFLSNGESPLWIKRNGIRQQVVFPKNTIVIDPVLLSVSESARLRFSMAHEGSHFVINKHIPGQNAACFRSIFDGEAKYEFDDLKRIFSLNESLTDRLSAAFLMPHFLVTRVLDHFSVKNKLTVYGSYTFPEEDKLLINKMADSMGVSYSSFVKRLKELKLLNQRDMSEYIQNKLLIGGDPVGN